MKTTSISEDEKVALTRDSGLDFRSAPALIKGVSSSQFSVSRHHGGCYYAGHHYQYNPVHDELVRHDVGKWLEKYREKEKKRVHIEKAALQGRLF